LSLSHGGYLGRTPRLIALEQSYSPIILTRSRDDFNVFQSKVGAVSAGEGLGMSGRVRIWSENQPTFSGMAAPFSVVQLLARPFGFDTQEPRHQAERDKHHGV
jgi:hypothetical protein